MLNPYINASYMLSAHKLSQLPPDSGFELAFAGRSNSGKSSAINTLCQQKSLARTSKTPGRTQQIIFFRIDDERRLVDLPGYGYAKVSESVKKQWQQTMESYLNQRNCLAGLLLTMDIRHPMREFDEQMLAWCAHVNMPVHVLLTKSDKLKRNAAKTTLLKVNQMLKQLNLPASVQLFSALKHTGLEEAIAVMNKWLNIEQINAE